MASDTNPYHGQASQPNTGVPEGWPLLQLPDAAKEQVASSLLLEDRRRLRLCCKATLALADALVTRLHFKAAGPFKPGLQQRFPRVRLLGFDGGDMHFSMDPLSIDPAKTNALQHGVSQLFSAEPWHAISSLHLQSLPAATAAVVVGGCPCAATVTVGIVYGFAADAYDVPATVRHICSLLPSLSSLSVGKRHPLGDAEAAGIASRTALTSLTASLDNCGAAGWAAVLSLRSLAALDLHRAYNASVPAEIQPDFSPMSALRHLAIKGVDYEEEEDGDDVDSGDPAYVALQLPAALTYLSLQRLPRLAFKLPQLTSLHLSKGSVGHASLARIAKGCPALTTLKVFYLEVLSISARTPLRQLTRLTVLRRCIVEAGARLAAVFPALQALSLRAECEFANGGRALAGLASLCKLDLGRSVWDGVVDWHGPGLNLQAADFIMFNEMQLLHEMRLNITAAHVKGLSSITGGIGISNITWVVDAAQYTTFAGIPAALRTHGPPADLVSATVQFCYEAGGEPDEYETRPFILAVSGVADALTLWLQRAELGMVAWDASDCAPCAALTDLRLFALASAPSIIYMNVRQHYMDGLSDSCVSHLQGLFGDRPLLIDVCTCGTYEGWDECLSDEAD